MTRKTKAREIVEMIKADERLEVSDVFYYGDDDKSVRFMVLEEGGAFEFIIDGKGEKITLYDQMNSEYEYDDENLVVAKVRQYVSGHNPIRDEQGEIIREGKTGKKEALGKTAVGCLQLLPVVVALGVLIIIARACASV
jgi:hypothetical protein